MPRITIPPIIPSILTDTDNYSLYLLDKQIKGTVLLIVSNLLILLSSFQGKEVIYRKYRSIQGPSIKPDETALSASTISLIAVAYLLSLANERTEQISNFYEQGVVGEEVLGPTQILNNTSLFSLIISIISYNSISDLNIQAESKRQEQAFIE